jgi:hypothetical protein
MGLRGGSGSLDIVIPANERVKKLDFLISL